MHDRFAQGRAALAVAVAVAALAVAPAPAAAEAWIFRPITLPRGSAALDFGFAIGRQDAGPAGARTGPGVNLEAAFAVASELELGLRLGFRFGGGGRATRADEYARIFDTETYGSYTDGGGATSDTVANPEVRLRWGLARGPVLQLAFEGRFFLPIESGSRFGVMPALPLWLRFGAVRLDTGVYVPIIFTDNTTTVVSLPLAVWIQASSRAWLGPDVGVRFWESGARFTTYPFGFGLGYALTHAADLRFRIFFRDIGGSAAARNFGAGVAFQFRT